ncbi:protein of unknown function [Aminobacter niigataensis]|nr:protein of unknown function [Aminobacter niigataensis]
MPTAAARYGSAVPTGRCAPPGCRSCRRGERRPGRRRPWRRQGTGPQKAWQSGSFGTVSSAVPQSEVRPHIMTNKCSVRVWGPSFCRIFPAPSKALNRFGFTRTASARRQWPEHESWPNTVPKRPLPIK